MVGCGVALVVVALACIVPSVLSFVWDDLFGNSAYYGYNPYPGGTPSASGLDLPDPPGPVRPVGVAPGITARTVEFSVTSVTGLPAVTTGAYCTFTLNDRGATHGTGRCQTQVYCNGIALYGDGVSNGYLDCELTTSEPSGYPSATDAESTATDGDASLTLTPSTSEIVISDDATGPNGAFVVRGYVSRVY